MRTMALVRSDQKGMEEVQRIRAALAEGRPVLTEAQQDLIKQQTALLGEDGDAIIRGIQEEAESAGRLPADISKIIEKCCQDLGRSVARLERSNEVQREREPHRLLQDIREDTGQRKGENNRGQPALPVLPASRQGQAMRGKAKASQPCVSHAKLQGQAHPEVA